MYAVAAIRDGRVGELTAFDTLDEAQEYRDDLRGISKTLRIWQMVEVEG